MCRILKPIHYWDVNLRIGRKYILSNTTKDYLESWKWGIYQRTTTLVSATFFILILRSVRGAINIDVAIVWVALDSSVTSQCHECCTGM